MQKTQDSLNKPETAPVELSVEQLQLVSGGAPRGGWGQEGSTATTTTTTAATAATLADPTPAPRGGW
jgi:hypothetical protein